MRSTNKGGQFQFLAKQLTFPSSGAEGYTILIFNHFLS